MDEVRRVWVVPDHQQACGPDGFSSPSREAKPGREEEAETRKVHAFTQVQTRTEAGRLFRHLVCFRFITAETRLGLVLVPAEWLTEAGPVWRQPLSCRSLRLSARCQPDAAGPSGLQRNN